MLEASYNIDFDVESQVAKEQSPILQMNKPSHKGINWFSQSHSSSRWKKQDQESGISQI